MRGHQVSTAHHASSLKTWAEFRKYVSDLAVFGTTQIEVAHIVPLCDDTVSDGTNGSTQTKPSCALPEGALVNFSQALHDAHLNALFWD